MGAAPVGANNFSHSPPSYLYTEVDEYSVVPKCISLWNLTDEKLSIMADLHKYVNGEPNQMDWATATELKLDSTKTKPMTLQQCAWLCRHAFICCPQLQVLSLINNNFGAHGMKALCHELDRHCRLLTELNLGGNDFGDTGVDLLCHSILADRDITVLSLEDNKILDFGVKMLCKTSLKRYENLTHLNLSANPFGDTGVVALTTIGLLHSGNMKSILLSGTRMTSLGEVALVNALPQWPKLERLEGVDLKLHAQALDLPVEFQDKSNEEILLYLKQKREDVLVSVSRMRVMLVGPGEAGKTTLAHKLISNRFTQGEFSITDGVEMREWHHGNVMFQLWDFGGQEVYFNTHAMFFDSRCVYLIVWNPRSTPAHDTTRMLDEYFAQVLNKGLGAPIILVSTRADDGVSAMFGDVFVALQIKYPTLQAYFHVGFQTGANVEALKAKLVEVALAHEHVTDLIPQKYDNVEKHLKAMRTDTNFSISNDAYLAVLRSTNLDVTQAGLLLSLLHKWGVVHLLPGGDIVLHPMRLADIMKRVVTYVAQPVAPSSDTQSNMVGILDHAHLNTIWAEYEPQLHAQFLALFHSCELAFPLFNSTGTACGKSLVPAMLPPARHSPMEIAVLCFSNRFTEAHLYGVVKIVFSARLTNFFPKLHARLRAMATLGGTWREAFFVTLNDAVNEELSSALLQVNAFTGNIRITYRLCDDKACAAAIRCIRVLLDEQFQALEDLDATAEPVPLTPARFAASLVNLLRRVRERGSTRSDVTDLSLELMKCIPDICDHCKLVPVSPGRSASDPWNLVHGVSLPYGVPVDLSPLDSIIIDCLFELGLPRCGARLVDMSAHQNVLCQLQSMNFEKKAIADGVEIFLQNQAAVQTMISLSEVQSKQRELLEHQRTILDELLAVRQMQLDTVFNVHQMPLLLSVTQPKSKTVSGWFARSVQNVYRLHFVCPVCGRKGATGYQGKGLRFVITKPEIVLASKCLNYTLQAVEILSLASPYPMPHLSKLAHYLPNAANITEFGLDGLHAEAQRRMDLHDIQKCLKVDEKVPKAVKKKAIGAAKVSLSDVQFMKELVLLTGEKIPPRQAGLQPVFYERTKCSWVCLDSAPVLLPDGFCGPALPCAERFRREGVACLSIYPDLV
eukprot:gene13306-15328_t